MKKNLVKEEGGLKFKPPLSQALRNVQRHFPQVTKIQDAKQPLAIEVTKKDEQGSTRKDHEKCAMAQACKRAYQADGVIVSRTMAYLIKGNLAVRFKVPSTVAREITSFDRGSGFNPGFYQLSVPQPMEYRNKINAQREGRKDTPAKKKHKYHRTENIRAVLGSVDDKG